MEEKLSYLEKIENKQKIISNILINILKIIDCDKKIAKIKSEEENFEMEMNNFEDIEKWEIKFGEPINNLGKEKAELEKLIYNLKEEVIIMGIPVPNNKGYEIINGLPNMNRDVNLKLVFYLTDDNKIRQVFYYYYFLI
jgi:hypothetical protein